MQIFINLKRIGKKPQGAVRKEEYQISDDIKTVRELIIDIVTGSVEAFNERVDGGEILRHITTDEIMDRASVGKVAFGELHNPKKQRLDKAIENALISFEDGIYCIFINDRQVEELETPLHLSESDELTFVRLTMLAGRMW